MWLKPSGGKRGGEMSGGGPSLHQNHLELSQKPKFIPVFLEGIVVLSKKKIQFAQI